MAVSAFFGILGAALVLTGRTSTSLRCPSCRCRFPAPMGAGRATLLVGLGAGIACVAAYWLVSEFADEAIAWPAVVMVALLGFAVVLRVLRGVSRRWRRWCRCVEEAARPA